MKYLITGGCGFLGSNLAAHVLKKNEELIIFDNLSRVEVDQNLKWLKERGDFQFIKGDIRSFDDITKAIRDNQPSVIFHLASQVAMTTSLVNPRLDFEVNVMGTFNLLEAVRTDSPNSAIIFSSTNKVYGDLEHLRVEELPLRYIATDYPKGFNENTPLDFHSPYGCSKGSADQYILDYARMYHLCTVVFRHSSLFGFRQFSTFDQGWVGWFIKQALERLNHPASDLFTITGTGKQVRDILFVEDAVSCYFQAVEHIEKCKQQVFNIGGGFENSLSLLELFQFLEKELHVKLQYNVIPWRQSDQKVYISDIQKAKKYFKWSPVLQLYDGLRRMIDWSKENVG